MGLLGVLRMSGLPLRALLQVIFPLARGGRGLPQRRTCLAYNTFHSLPAEDSDADSVAGGNAVAVAAGSVFMSKDSLATPRTEENAVGSEAYSVGKLIQVSLYTKKE